MRDRMRARWPFQDALDLVSTVAKAEGGWMPAKPQPGPFVWDFKRRVAAAWAVFRGRAAAVEWR